MATAGRVDGGEEGGREKEKKKERWGGRVRESERERKKQTGKEIRGARATRQGLTIPQSPNVIPARIPFSLSPSSPPPRFPTAFLSSPPIQISRARPPVHFARPQKKTFPIFRRNYCFPGFSIDARRRGNGMRRRRVITSSRFVGRRRMLSLLTRAARKGQSTVRVIVRREKRIQHRPSREPSRFHDIDVGRSSRRRFSTSWRDTRQAVRVSDSRVDRHLARSPRYSLDSEYVIIRARRSYSSRWKSRTWCDGIDRPSTDIDRGDGSVRAAPRADILPRIFRRRVCAKYSARNAQDTYYIRRAYMRAYYSARDTRRSRVYIAAKSNN